MVLALPVGFKLGSAVRAEMDEVMQDEVHKHLRWKLSGRDGFEDLARDMHVVVQENASLAQMVSLLV